MFCAFSVGAVKGIGTYLIFSRVYAGSMYFWPGFCAEGFVLHVSHMREMQHDRKQTVFILLVAAVAAGGGGGVVVANRQADRTKKSHTVRFGDVRRLVKSCTVYHGDYDMCFCRCYFLYVRGVLCCVVFIFCLFFVYFLSQQGWCWWLVPRPAS